MGLDEETTRRLEQLAEDTHSPDQWEELADGANNRYFLYVSLETVSLTMYAHDSVYIPSLLQTRRYVRALYDRDALANKEDRGAAEELRVTRQNKYWSRTKPIPRSVFIIGEAALKCIVGDDDTMQEQLEHLREATTWKNVEIWVTPLRNGSHRSMGVEYTILDFPPKTSPSTVFLPGPRQIAYLTRTKEVEFYRSIFEHSRKFSIPLKEYQ